MVRDEGGGEAEVSLEGVPHYLKIRPRSASGDWDVLGSWVTVITVYIFVSYCADKRLKLGDSICNKNISLRQLVMKALVSRESPFFFSFLFLV